GVQHFDGHLTLEPQVARPEYPPEPPRADLVEQLVVVAQGAAQAPFETDFGDLRRGGGLLEDSGFAHEVFQHLGRSEVPVTRPGLERAQQHAPQDSGHGGPHPPRRDQLRGIGIGLLACDGVVDDRRHRVHIARRLPRAAGPHLGGNGPMGRGGSQGNRETRRRTGAGSRGGRAPRAPRAPAGTRRGPAHRGRGARAAPPSASAADPTRGIGPAQATALRGRPAGSSARRRGRCGPAGRWVASSWSCRRQSKWGSARPDGGGPSGRTGGCNESASGGVSSRHVLLGGSMRRLYLAPVLALAASGPGVSTRAEVVYAEPASYVYVVPPERVVVVTREVLVSRGYVVYRV